jgi:hypothetical protein
MTTHAPALQTPLRSSTRDRALSLLRRRNRPGCANDSRAHEGLIMTPRSEPLVSVRVAALRDRLTADDEVILKTLTTVHLATTGQLQRLTLDRQPVRTAEVLTAQRLQRLRRLGLTTAFLRRPSDRRPGRPGYLHALTADGRVLVGGRYAIGGERPRKTWRPGDQFVAHRLGISELYIRLVERSRLGGPTVREFQAEPDSWRSYTGPDGERLIIRPDALVRLEQAGLEISWNIELDRGTEPARTLVGKCQAYRAYELSGVEQRRHQVFPAVMFVVPGGTRLRLVERVIARQPDSARSLFIVASEEDAVDRLADPDQPAGPQSGQEEAA